jgi:NlpC/P60 family
MRSLARRLVPLVVFIVVLGLAIAGVFSRSRSQLALRSGPAGPAYSGTGTFGPGTPGHPGGVGGAGDTTGAGTTGAGNVSVTAAGVSPAVGSIPGGRAGARQWQYAAGRSGPVPAAVMATTAKPIRSLVTLPSRLGQLRQADVIAVGSSPLSPRLLGALRKLPGVRADVAVAAGRVQVNGVFVNVLGVDPATFRPFAAGPTARSTLLWQNIAAGGMAISYTMGSQARLSLSKPVKVTGARTLTLPVAGFGTVGVGGVDAVVSAAVAKSLGLPSANAIIMSAPAVRLDKLMAKVKKLMPAQVAVTALVTQVIVHGAQELTGAAGAITISTGDGPGLTTLELLKFLTAAESRIGMPYVWGAAGPTSFDCSGLVQWSLARAGVAMPRVAADQARTGPLVPLRDLQPGDLLFYHTDPTAPDYISHVAIYIGNGEMEQAPEPGMDVEIVKADFGAGFAGAIAIFPRLAAAVAGYSVG